VLEVRVDSSVWGQQLQVRSAEIVAALRELLGEAAPTELRFRLG
jgi:predicted nucleic acid-binding Zn ribbon protein